MKFPNIKQVLSFLIVLNHFLWVFFLFHCNQWIIAFLLMLPFVGIMVGGPIWLVYNTEDSKYDKAIIKHNKKINEFWRKVIFDFKHRKEIKLKFKEQIWKEKQKDVDMIEAIKEVNDFLGN